MNPVEQFYNFVTQSDMVKTLNNSNNTRVGELLLWDGKMKPKRKGTNEIKSLDYRYVFQTPLYPSIYACRAIAMPEVVKANVALIGIEAWRRSPCNVKKRRIIFDCYAC